MFNYPHILFELIHLVLFLHCSIFPSPEQNPGLSHYQGSLNTGGSLPDLSNLHFPSPLSTPLDPEDNRGYPSLSGGSSTGNLPAAMMHLGIGNSQGGCRKIWFVCMVPKLFVLRLAENNTSTLLAAKTETVPIAQWEKLLKQDLHIKGNEGNFIGSVKLVFIFLPTLKVTMHSPQQCWKWFKHLLVR